jgi:helix-turn-helix protein
MNNKTLGMVAAVIGALHEVGSAPHSAIYMALGMDLDLCMKLTNAMVDADLIKIERSLLSLTPKGVEIATRLGQA